MRVLIEKKYFFIDSMKNFFYYVEYYPEFSELLIAEFLKDKTTCLLLLKSDPNSIYDSRTGISTYKNLLRLIKQFPNHKAVLFENVFTGNKDLWNLIDNPAKLAGEVPEYKQALLQDIQANEEEFFRSRISSSYELSRLIEFDLNCAEYFIDNYLSKDEEYFKEIFYSWHHLTSVLNISSSLRSKFENLLFSEGKPNIKCMRLFSDYSAFLHAINQFSQYKEPLFSILLEEDLFFERMVKDAYELTCILKEHPQYTQPCLDKLLGSDEQFQRLVDSYPTLRDICKNYPQYGKAIVEKALGNPLQMRDILGNQPQFEDFLEKFKTYIGEVTRIVLNDYLLLRRLINSLPSLTRFLEITAGWIEPEEIVRKVFSPSDSLKKFLNKFISPYGSGKELAKLARFVPQTAEEILLMILDDKQLFYKMFSWDSFRQLIAVMKAFPQYQDLLLYKTSRDSDIFKAVVSEHEFDLFKSKFSDRKLFQTTRNEAIQQIEDSCKEMENTNRVLKRVKKEHSYARSALDNYTIRLMTSFTPNPDVHNKETSEEVANEMCTRLG